MDSRKTINAKLTERELAEFRRNARWYGDDNLSQVIRNLIEAFNKASTTCRANNATIMQPFQLRIGVMRELVQPAKNEKGPRA